MVRMLSGLLRCSVSNFTLPSAVAVAGAENMMLIGDLVLMFVLWYCHKRGKDVRLEKEKAEAAEMEGRVEELSDIDSAIGSASTPLGLESRTSPPLLESPGAGSSRR